jgi:hypothetical protein
VVMPVRWIREPVIAISSTLDEGVPLGGWGCAELVLAAPPATIPIIVEVSSFNLQLLAILSVHSEGFLLL